MLERLPAPSKSSNEERFGSQKEHKRAQRITVYAQGETQIVL